jgi:hypothetical protein
MPSTQPWLAATCSTIPQPCLRLWCQSLQFSKCMQNDWHHHNSANACKAMPFQQQEECPPLVYIGAADMCQALAYSAGGTVLHAEVSAAATAATTTQHLLQHACKACRVNNTGFCFFASYSSQAKGSQIKTCSVTRCSHKANMDSLWIPSQQLSPHA